MDTSARIYVAGHTGLVGSALVRRLGQLGYGNLILKTHQELDLTDATAVRDFFGEVRPEYVFLAAAKVGGILANDSFPAEFIFDNLRIQTNVIHESWHGGVQRLLFLGSSCIYPKLAPQPLRESFLLTGPLEQTNRSYAVAKIAGIEMCWAYNRQYGTQFLAAMPTNLFGPGDNYDANNSHLVPALIRKIHDAKVQGLNQIVIWGTGSPRRDFLHSDDAADASIFLMNLPKEELSELLESRETPPLVNVGSGTDMTVVELATLIAEVIGVRVSFTFDPTKPDGTPRKLLNTDRLTSLGWKPRIGLREGLRQTYQDFCSSVVDGQSVAIGTLKTNV